MSEANDAVLARTQPARSTTPERSSTPDSCVGGAERRADEDPGLPGAVVTPARAAAFGTHRASAPRSTGSTDGKSEPNSRRATSENRAGSPVVSWTCVVAELADPS